MLQNSLVGFVLLDTSAVILKEICFKVMLEGHNDHLFNAHIQEIVSDGESAVVFVEELGERLSWFFLLSML